jgi:hypothetical protein
VTHFLRSTEPDGFRQDLRSLKTSRNSRSSSRLNEKSRIPVCAVPHAGMDAAPSDRNLEEMIPVSRIFVTRSEQSFRAYQRSRTPLPSSPMKKGGRTKETG